MEDLALAEELVGRLSILIEDPEILELFNRFMSLSVSVPSTVVDHPSLQFASDPEGVNPSLTVEFGLRFLGLLNGMVGVKEDGWGYIVADFDADNLVGFRVLYDPAI